MEDEIIISPQLEFHLFRNYKAYEEFMKGKGMRRCCMMMKLDPFTCNIRDLAGVTKEEYQIVVAMLKVEERNE